MTLRIAAVATVYNEALLLPQFLSHYGPEVDAIFLIDNQSTDGSLALLDGHAKVELSSLDTDGEFRTSALCAARMAKAKECAGSFDYVLVVDCDEFLVPKDGRTLRESLARSWPQDILGTEGHNMWRHPEEPPYDPAVPLVAQRRWGAFDPRYSKPIVFRPAAPFEFKMGFHEVVDGHWSALLKQRQFASLRLLHYVGVEEDEYVRRCMARASRISEENVENGWGQQYFDGSEESFRARFREAQASPGLVRLPFSLTGAG